jgi:threonine dehydrogenase-like Zn-dependent dehydrogenase
MSASTAELPSSHAAVQLVGPGELRWNTDKPLAPPGPHHIVAKVEAVGLCFSDLKLLKQFSEHPRKGPIVRGVEADVLSGLPSYKPGDEPTVPGHEACVRIVAVGEKVSEHKVGERYLVQADWRQAMCALTNGAFGYNFEGALQEYVVMDERVVIDAASGDHFLVPVGDARSAAAVALIEPWACVECSYVSPERRTIKAGGSLLVVADSGRTIEGLVESFSPEGPPASVTTVLADAGQKTALDGIGVKVSHVGGADELADESFDDIVYFGSTKFVIDVLNDKLAREGICNVVLDGARIGEPVAVGVGRVHYGLTRWIGTRGSRADSAYEVIPATGEVRAGDKIVVVGAGGPMGQMHVIRDAALGLAGVEITATDFDDDRLASLRAKAAGVAESAGVPLRVVNPKTETLTEAFTYHAIMVPVGPLVAEAIACSGEGGLINIFAGIPAPTKQDIDLDTYIAKGLFMFGTSGSKVSDMLIVRDKVEQDRLDTNLSVDAVSGMAGAVDGISAVENRTIPGKILVYPQLGELPLTTLDDLAGRFPSVGRKLRDGLWTREAEDELLRVAE